MEEKIKELIKAELEKANAKFPQFSSSHEGYAVLLEEVEELQEDVKNVEMFKNGLWDRIKENSIDDVLISKAAYIKNFATHAATEAIQVAAMAQKFIDMLETEKD